MDVLTSLAVLVRFDATAIWHFKIDFFFEQRGILIQQLPNGNTKRLD